MTTPKIYYCAGAFARSDAGAELLSIAFVHPDGQWYYAEVVDFDLSACDDVAQAKVLPVLMRVPGAEFMHTSEQMAQGIYRFLSVVAQGGLTLRFFDVAGQPERLMEAVKTATADLGLCINFEACQINPELSEAFFDRCGGQERVLLNSYALALHAGICDVRRSQPSHIHEIPLIQVEMLMGSKNAASYRAWARGVERSKVVTQPGQFG